MWHEHGGECSYHRMLDLSDACFSAEKGSHAKISSNSRRDLLFGMRGVQYMHSVGCAATASVDACLERMKSRIPHRMWGTTSEERAVT